MKIKTIIISLIAAISTVTAEPISLTNLSGETVKGEVTSQDNYSITIMHDAGIQRVAIAELSPDDLTKYNTVDRNNDGKFWFERGNAIERARTVNKTYPAIEQEIANKASIITNYMSELSALRELGKVAKQQEEAARAERFAKRSAENEKLEKIQKIRNVYNKYVEMRNTIVYLSGARKLELTNLIEKSKDPVYTRRYEQEFEENKRKVRVLQGELRGLGTSFDMLVAQSGLTKEEIGLKLP